MQQIVSQNVIPTAALIENKTNLNVPITPEDPGNADTEVVKGSVPVNRLFQLSMCGNDLDSTQNFYNNILSIEEQQDTKSSVYFDFYPCKLTHEVVGYSAKTIQREVEAEAATVSHFAAYLIFEEKKSSGFIRSW